MKGDRSPRLAEPREQKSATIREAPWISILVALVAFLSFLLTLAGIPETTVEIVLADAIFVALVAILVYRIETHLASVGRRTLLRGRPGWALTFTAIALGAIAGTLAQLASSADHPPVTRAIAVYERQVREVLDPLRETSAGAFEASASHDPDLYAKNAREVSEAYRLASEVLARVESARPRDQALHSLLVASLGVVGVTYSRLGTAVARSAGSTKVAAAQARVKGAIEDLQEVEEALDRRGYRVSLAS